MGLPVILTPQSQADLKAIVAYIARDDRERAKKFGYLLIDKALSLNNLPERGRVVPELNDSDVREIIHGSYRIIYEFLHEPDVVYVLRFWHAAQGEPDFERMG